MNYFLKKHLIIIFTVNTWPSKERVTFSLSIKLYFGVPAVAAFWSQWHWKDNFLNNPFSYKSNEICSLWKGAEPAEYL